MRANKRTLRRSAFVLLTALVMVLAMIPAGLTAGAADDAADVAYLSDLITSVTSTVTANNNKVALTDTLVGWQGGAPKPVAKTAAALAPEFAALMETNLDTAAFLPFSANDTFANLVGGLTFDDFTGFQLIKSSRTTGALNGNNFDVTLNPDYVAAGGSFVLLYLGQLDAGGGLSAEDYLEYGLDANTNALAGNVKTNSLTSQPNGTVEGATRYFAVMYFGPMPVPAPPADETQDAEVEAYTKLAMPEYTVIIPALTQFGGPAEADRIPQLSSVEVASLATLGISRYEVVGFDVECIDCFNIDGDIVVTLDTADFELSDSGANTMAYTLFNGAVDVVSASDSDLDTTNLVVEGDVFATFTGDDTAPGFAVLDRAEIDVHSDFTDTMTFTIVYIPN